MAMATGRAMTSKVIKQDGKYIATTCWVDTEPEKAAAAAEDKAAAAKAREVMLERRNAKEAALQRSGSSFQEPFGRFPVTRTNSFQEQFGNTSSLELLGRMNSLLGPKRVPFTCCGWMEKKSGGHSPTSTGSNPVMDSWDKRWFVLLPGSPELTYYKSRQAHEEGAEPLGSVNLKGCDFFLKERPKKDVHRWTVRTCERELKLRAASTEDYEYWTRAVKQWA